MESLKASSFSPPLWSRLYEWLNSLLARYRGWEYWNTFVFEAPAYLRLAAKLLYHRLDPRHLCKVNWALDHGGFAFSSKFEIQNSFPAEGFPTTIVFDSDTGIEANLARIAALQEQQPRLVYPLIFKPDNGRIGRGVVRVRNIAELRLALGVIEGRYLVQEFCSLPFEAGVFFARVRGMPRIFSMTMKEFPHVVGNGVNTVEQLINHDQRLCRFRNLLSKQIDFAAVPAPGEVSLLSYVGNHAQGTVFSSPSREANSLILARIIQILGDHPGFNYGRLDVRARSAAAFWDGDFIALEVNGVDSLSTNLFDPKWSILDAYAQLFKQYDLLVNVAVEQRAVAMKINSWQELYRRTAESEARLLRNHERLVGLGLR